MLQDSLSIGLLQVINVLGATSLNSVRALTARTATQPRATEEAITPQKRTYSHA